MSSDETQVADHTPKIEDWLYISYMQSFREWLKNEGPWQWTKDVAYGTIHPGETWKVAKNAPPGTYSPIVRGIDWAQNIMPYGIQKVLGHKPYRKTPSGYERSKHFNVLGDPLWPSEEPERIARAKRIQARQRAKSRFR